MLHRCIVAVFIGATVALRATIASFWTAFLAAFVAWLGAVRRGSLVGVLSAFTTTAATSTTLSALGVTGWALLALTLFATGGVLVLCIQGWLAGVHWTTFLVKTFALTLALRWAVRATTASATATACTA